ncbi:MAG: hypothetical protein ACLUI3_09910 [Christensenellales bacterium]
MRVLDNISRGVQRRNSQALRASRQRQKGCWSHRRLQQTIPIPASSIILTMIAIPAEQLISKSPKDIRDMGVHLLRAGGSSGHGAGRLHGHD